MLKIIRERWVFAKICLVLVYVSFYWVQLQVQANQASRVAFFSGEFTLSHGHKDGVHFSKKETHPEPKPAKFRLNKRFQPEHLFTVPQALPDLVNYPVLIHVVLLPATQPPADIAFNFPSLRGPPCFV
jgi:hypothetical protein